MTHSRAALFNFNLCRFKEDKGEIAALRTKEQGDWKKLTTEEKKVKYTPNGFLLYTVHKQAIILSFMECVIFST